MCNLRDKDPKSRPCDHEQGKIRHGVFAVKKSAFSSSASKGAGMSCSRCKSAAIGLAVLVLLTGPVGKAWAQTAQAGQSYPANLSQLSLKDLGNIEVTSVSKEPEHVRNTPAAIFVITQEDIRRSGATSVPEALRLAPGVDVAQIDSDHWSISIRGFAGQFSKSLLVLIDGRSVYTPLFSGVYWDVQNLLLEDVDRIEVIRGPGGTIWGSNAVNGVINIITKNSRDTHGALATVGGGTVDQATGSVRYGGSVGKDLDYRIYGMGFIRGSEFHPDGDGFDDWRMGQLGFRTDWKMDDRDTFTLQGDTYSGATGERVNIASFSPPSQIMPDDTAFVSGGNIVARWRRDRGQGSDIQVQGYFDRTNFQDLELGETRSTFDLDFVQHQAIRGGQKLTWGLGMRLSPSNFIQTSGVNFLPNRQTDSIYSGFAQYDLPIITDKLTLTAGTKLEHNNFSGFEYQPSVRLLWTPTVRQSFWLAATRAVRTPSRLDQDVVFPIFVTGPTPTVPFTVYYDIAGNPNFLSERLLSYEAGYRTAITPRVYLDVATFYNFYKDLQSYGPISLALATTPPPTPPPNQPPTYAYIVLPYANGIEGHTLGAEIAPDWQITPRWQVRGSYSFLHMSLRDAPGYTDTGNILGSYAGSSPSHSLGLQSLLNLPKRLELDLNYRYVSALAAQGVRAYGTGDARLGWHATDNLEFSVIGHNLLQPQHAEFAGDPGPIVEIKRGVFGKITWTE
jgi:iron complex outermembrane receptor protein